MRERSSPLLSRIWWFVVLGVMCGSLSALFVAPFAVRAMPPLGWTHDHSAAGIPTRPHGYNRLVAVFGQPCNNAVGCGALVVAVAVHARCGRLHHVSPVYRPRRELERP